MMRFLQLGASLYMPATRRDLLAIGNGQKHPQLRSVIYCTEDAIRPEEVGLALHQLEGVLPRLEPGSLLRFVRVRNPSVLRSVLQMEGVQHLTGFVFPKVTRHNLEEYFAALKPDLPLQVMLTLETAEVFDPFEMLALRTLIMQDHYRHRILSLRIGGNDLLQLLGLRRQRQHTIYATPLGAVISQLVTFFRPCGFNLTGPVCERLDRDAVLARETRKDLAHGLFGKSAIHPDQVPVIQAQYKVSRPEIQAADKILAGEAPPVFRWHNAMCEPATHRVWAQLIHERAKLYGVRDMAIRPRVLPLLPSESLETENSRNDSREKIAD
jgi:citrate lyase beta subunit